jgi:hypothetical protein
MTCAEPTRLHSKSGMWGTLSFVALISAWILHNQNGGTAIDWSRTAMVLG